MRIQASAPRDKTKWSLQDWCYKLTLTAENPNPEAREFEEEFLGRLYREMRNGNTGYWLDRLRKVQAPAEKGKNPPKRKPIPKGNKT